MAYPERTPKLARGGLVLLDPETNQVLRVIALQYNPDTLTRSLQIRGVGGDGAEFSEALRLKGPPVETIKLEAEIDATDGLETGDATAQSLGLHTQLAQLEMLVHPASSDLRANHREASGGSIEIVALTKPLLLFVWSAVRVLPVRITELSVTEESFDAALNPLRARISLGLRVLSSDDTGFASRAGALFISALEEKERLAGKAAGGPLSALGINSIPGG